jgi:hypothetical protein
VVLVFVVRRNKSACEKLQVDLESLLSQCFKSIFGLRVFAYLITALNFGSEIRRVIWKMPIIANGVYEDKVGS